MRLLYVVLLSVLAMQAGTVFTFEPATYTAPASVAGQDGWYNPSATDPAGQVLTYASSAYPANPGGGAQFLHTFGTDNDARAEHAFDFSGASTWTLSYDVLLSNHGDKEAMAIAGEFTLWSTPIETAEDPGFMTIFGFTGTTANANWGILYYLADAGGTMQQDAAWAGLSQDNWYRVTTVFDVATKQILGGSLYDLTDDSAYPNWTPSAARYFTGGSASTFMPNAIRMFSNTDSGDPTIANAVAWDNVSLSSPDDGGPAGVPEPATVVMAGAALAALALWRRR
jgi:hypothetical protein